MNAKSFLFVGAWMQPLKTLPLEQRWNVLEAIVEYSTSGEVTITLNAMETLAFMFIRHEIDRMKEHRAELRETRRESANKRWKKGQKAVAQAKEEATIDANDANVCKAKQEDAPFISESVSESVSKPVSEKSTTTATCVRARGNAGKDAPYHDSELLPRFFDSSNQAKLEALAMKHRTPIATLRTMAEEITLQWALTDKTHDSYHDAASHLIFALADKVQRERKSRLQAISDGGTIGEESKGLLGVGEYVDSEGRRTYNGIDFIPNDAPPRPGKAFYWNAATNSWDDIQ